MRLGIRGQLFIPLLAAVAGFLVVSLVAAREAVHRERTALNTHIDEIGRTLDNAHFQLTGPILQQMKGLTGADYCLVQPGHETVTTLPNRPSLSDLRLDDSTNAGTDMFDRPMEWSGTSYFVRYYRPGPLHKNAGGTLAILFPVARWNESVAAALRPILMLGFLGFLVAVAMTLGLGGRLVGRIRRLEAHTRRIAEGDFTPMPLPDRHDELCELGASVNAMAGRLKELQDSLREGERWRVLGQVSGGLAHQLRNGVTGAKLALQLHTRESNVASSESLQVAVRQLLLIETQLQRFLELGRGSSEPVTANSLPDLAEEVSSLIRPRCRHFGIALTLHAAPDLPTIHAERGQLLQVLLNLLENAIDACGPGGAVELQVLAADGRMEASVFDTGPGPPAEIAQRLFEPFVTGKPDGIGLGLTVVRKVIDAHRGTVSWERKDGRTCFRISIPLTADPSVGEAPPSQGLSAA